MASRLSKWRSPVSRLSALFSMLLLSSCMSLPGSESPLARQYLLQAEDASCTASSKILHLSVVKVAAGLDTDRIARMNRDTGEMDYLQGVRWVEEVGSMLEQRLAADLECRGFAVQTGHRTRLEHAQLQCEVRALNLVSTGSQDEAEVGLSCLYYRPGIEDSALIATAAVPLQRWSVKQAMTALSAAYDRASGELMDAMGSS